MGTDFLRDTILINYFMQSVYWQGITFPLLLEMIAILPRMRIILSIRVRNFEITVSSFRAFASIWKRLLRIE